MAHTVHRPAERRCNVRIVDSRSVTPPEDHPEHNLGGHLLPLTPQYRERVWGGQRLQPSNPPIGEAWIAFGESIVADGPFAGRKLADLAAQLGPALLGLSVHSRFGSRFPLLAKFLDCADWLSVQVHPNDEQARRMVGPGEFGKTEAWFFIEAAAKARILLGVKPGTTAAELATAIRGGAVVDVAATVPVQAGDAVLVSAGMLHALGPGLLVYEIQQESDTTYRAYDWGRPQSTGRKLHIEESVAVTTTDGPAEPASPAVSGEIGIAGAIACAYFDLDLVRVGATALPMDTGGRSFHILTAIEGAADIEVMGESGTETVRLERFASVLVAGSTGSYRARGASGSATLLKALVPD
jgi:mannose-6-phosphate isomerase